MQVGAHCAQRFNVLFIIGVIHKGAQKHAVVRSQMLEQVVGAHFVPLVGRIGQPVNQKKQVAHDWVQPRLRTINGPNQFARAKGMRRQVLIISLYLALLGLFCGMESRL